MKNFVHYIQIQNSIIESCHQIEKIDLLTELIYEKNKNQMLTILTAGNGGSSSTAEHFSADLSLTYNRTSKSINSICLSSQNSLMTALSNDLDYADSFAYQLYNWRFKNVVVVAFSASGNSKNIVKLLTKSIEFGIPSFCFVGFDGGIVSRIPEVETIFFRDDKKNYGQIENIHLSVCHYIIEKLNSKILSSA